MNIYVNIYRTIHTIMYTHNTYSQTCNFCLRLFLFWESSFTSFKLQILSAHRMKCWRYHMITIVCLKTYRNGYWPICWTSSISVPPLISIFVSILTFSIYSKGRIIRFIEQTSPTFIIIYILRLRLRNFFFLL